MPDTRQTPRITAAEPAWELEEAKARLSEVVRLAAHGQPQRVTVRGRSAVVVVAADEFDRLRAQNAAPNLHDLLSRSPGRARIGRLERRRRRQRRGQRGSGRRGRAGARARGTRWHS